MKQKKIYLGSDHAGFKLKEKIKKWMEKKKISFEDLGNTKLDSHDDYPDFAKKVSLSVVRNKSLGVLVCGSAQGMCIAANKVKGARAVIPCSLKEARLSREHNAANVICLSGWNSHLHQATKMIEKFIHTSFSKAPRHTRRLKKIKAMER